MRIRPTITEIKSLCEKEFYAFQKWKTEKNIKGNTEEIMLAYFDIMVKDLSFLVWMYLKQFWNQNIFFIHQNNNQHNTITNTNTVNISLYMSTICRLYYITEESYKFQLIQGEKNDKWTPNWIRRLSGPKVPDICLTGEEKPRKNLSWRLVPIGNRARVRSGTMMPNFKWFRRIKFVNFIMRLTTAVVTSLPLIQLTRVQIPVVPVSW